MGLSRFDCIGVDLRDILYGGKSRIDQYKHGVVRGEMSDETLFLRGTTFGCPFAMELPTRRRPSGPPRVQVLQAKCPGCPRWIHKLRLAPDGRAGCYACLKATDANFRLHRNEHALRGQPVALMSALATDRRRTALLALEAGPIRGKRPSAMWPGRRVLRGEVEPWPEELLQLRLEVFGLYPWE